ncbi:MAG TPA: 16S rRNA (guanine(966)-N(2))-methyltransferase RsmD [Burkholderiales bacterium]|nr:16S rRNA (guanine(966)-N(2))-methyltransferase RsmD [Burkholderiales bacterium]
MTAVGLPNRVRIVGGRWRSRLVSFPDVPGLRPTPDRVRETLFNWLGQDLTGKACIDLYAGSGVLGFEAASRNARLVVMVERDVQAMRALQENRKALDASMVQLHRADALEFVRSDAGTYDVVFADPPYAGAQREVLLAWLKPRLAGGGLVYLEGPEAFTPPQGWRAYRSARAGAVYYQLLEAQPH